MQNHLLNDVLMMALVRSSVGECRAVGLYSKSYHCTMTPSRNQHSYRVAIRTTRADRRVAVSILRLNMELICVFYFPNSNDVDGNTNLPSDYKKTNATQEILKKKLNVMLLLLWIADFY